MVRKIKTLGDTKQGLIGMAGFYYRQRWHSNIKAVTEYYKKVYLCCITVYLINFFQLIIGNVMFHTAAENTKLSTFLSASAILLGLKKFVFDSLG